VKRLWGALTRLSVLRFAMIGTGASRDAARLIAWFCAATFTWLGNRYFTFAKQRARGSAIFQEWLRFLGANSIGGVANVGTFFLLTHFASPPFNGTNLAFVCGVLVGLVFNFTLSKKLVFKGPLCALSPATKRLRKAFRRDNKKRRGGNPRLYSFGSPTL